jgi:hypothetical protein
LWANIAQPIRAILFASATTALMKPCPALILLSGGFYRHKTHLWPDYRLGYGQGIVVVTFVATRMGLDVLGWYQPDLVAQRLEFPGPVVSAGAGLHFVVFSRFLDSWYNLYHGALRRRFVEWEETITSVY